MNFIHYYKLYIESNNNIFTSNYFYDLLDKFNYKIDMGKLSLSFDGKENIIISVNIFLPRDKQYIIGFLCHLLMREIKKDIVINRNSDILDDEFWNIFGKYRNSKTNNFTDIKELASQLINNKYKKHFQDLRKELGNDLIQKNEEEYKENIILNIIEEILPAIIGEDDISAIKFLNNKLIYQ